MAINIKRLKLIRQDTHLDVWEKKSYTYIVVVWETCTLDYIRNAASSSSISGIL